MNIGHAQQSARVQVEYLDLQKPSFDRRRIALGRRVNAHSGDPPRVRVGRRCRRLALITAVVRLRAPSAWKIEEIYSLTVCSERPNSREMSLVGSPRLRQRNTSVCRGVSVGRSSASGEPSKIVCGR